MVTASANTSAHAYTGLLALFATSMALASVFTGALGVPSLLSSPPLLTKTPQLSSTGEVFALGTHIGSTVPLLLAEPPVSAPKTHTPVRRQSLK
jgi:hypothetical protein